MQKYLIEFTGEPCGILIPAESWQEAKEAVENLNNWRDSRPHEVCYIAAVYSNAPDYVCYKK